jgi:hypothetical protein
MSQLPVFLRKKTRELQLAPERRTDLPHSSMKVPSIPVSRPKTRFCRTVNTFAIGKVADFDEYGVGAACLADFPAGFQ